EVFHRHPERTVTFQVDQLVVDKIDVFRLAVWREPHQLVLAGIDPKADEMGKSRIEQTDRMREAHFSEQLDAVAAPDAIGCGRPFTDAVEGQNGGFLEW